MERFHANMYASDGAKEKRAMIVKAHNPSEKAEPADDKIDKFLDRIILRLKLLIVMAMLFAAWRLFY